MRATSHLIRPAIAATLLALCGIFLTACSEETEPVTRNEITSAEVSDDRTITISAGLTDAFLSEYSGNIYLFELPSDRGRNADLRGLEPVANARAESHMQFKLDLYDGVRSRLFSSFLLASYDKTTSQYSILTTATALSDPSELAEGETLPDADRSVKGLSVGTAADALELGASSALVEVSMGDLIRSDWAEDAIPYLWNGLTLYYNGPAVAELDDTVSAYTAAGIRVYLRISLRDPIETTPSCLYVPGATGLGAGNSGTCSYLPNVTDSRAAELLEGFFSFLSERYAAGTGAPGRGLCTDWIIGGGANDAAGSAVDGVAAPSLDSHVIRYEQLVRMAYMALRAETSSGRVFLSLDYHWSGRGLTGGFGAQAYLNAFRAEAALRGDFDWQVAAGLYTGSPRVWNTADADTDYLTATSFSRLTDLLASDTYRTADGQLRQVVLTDVAIPSRNDGSGTIAGDFTESDQAASYAYLYTAAAADARVEALFYAALTYDVTGADVPAAGLYTLDANGVRSNRMIATVMTVMGTDGAASYLTVVRQIIGAAFTRLEGSLTGQTAPLRSVTAEGTVGQISSSGSATDLLRFDTQPDGMMGASAVGGFVNTAGLGYLELVDAGQTQVLHAALRGGETSGPVGMTTTLPASALTGADDLLLDLLMSCPSGSTGALSGQEVTILLTRPAKGRVESGDGDLRCSIPATLTGSGWLTLKADISDFTDLLDPGDEVLLSVLLQSDPEASYDLYLLGVHLTGVTNDSTSAVLIVVLVGILVLVLAGMVVFLILRRRHLKKA